MDVISGKVVSTSDPSFQPSHLFRYWTNHTQGLPGLSSTETSRQEHVLSFDDTNLSPKQASSVAAPRFWKTSLRVLGDMAYWLWDLLTEFWLTLVAVCALFGCTSKDPVRETAGFFRSFWLLFRRASMQLYRNRATFVLDQLLHLGCGLFISVAIQNFDYLGRQPQTICNITPVVLRGRCQDSIDLIRESGIFLCLGVLFAGISAGSATFGRERVVYWRDKSSGMSTTPYFLGKLAADVPRIFMASLSFVLALIVFMSYRSSFAFLFLLVLELYFYAFAIGYFLSTFLRSEKVALAGAGVALALSLVFSGTIPSLQFVHTQLPSLAWLWTVSGPRWALEAFWLSEVGARSFISQKPPNRPAYQYRWEEATHACWMVLFIGLGWHFLAFLGLKLFYRQHQK